MLSPTAQQAMNNQMFHSPEKRRGSWTPAPTGPQSSPHPLRRSLPPVDQWSASSSPGPQLPMSPTNGGWQPVTAPVSSTNGGWQPVVQHQPPHTVYLAPRSPVQVPVHERVVEVEVIKEVPVERIVIKEVPVIREVEVIKEVIREVPVERIVYVDRIKEVEVIKEVRVEVPVEVPVEKIVYRDREVEVPVEKVVYRDREVHVHVPSVGLGMRIGGSTSGDGPFLVEEVIQGYAAARTGDIFPGDEIVRIDGRSIPSVGGIKAMTIGPAGTKTTVSLRRNAGPVFDVTMTRVSPTWGNQGQYDMHGGQHDSASWRASY